MTKWILVDRKNGVPVYPSNMVLTGVTSDKTQTPVYDYRDNPALKIAFFGALLGRKFQQEALPDS